VVRTCLHCPFHKDLALFWSREICSYGSLCTATLAFLRHFPHEHTPKALQRCENKRRSKISKLTELLLIVAFMSPWFAWLLQCLIIEKTTTQEMPCFFRILLTRERIWEVIQKSASAITEVTSKSKERTKMCEMISFLVFSCYTFQLHFIIFSSLFFSINLINAPEWSWNWLAYDMRCSIQQSTRWG
jgi:hypothetical protein